MAPFSPFVRLVPCSMKLPRRDRAFVPERKLTAYLLSLSHPVGRGKARFFRRPGFDLSNTDILTDGLLTLACQSNVVRAEQTDYGTKYVVDGLLAATRCPCTRCGLSQSQTGMCRGLSRRIRRSDAFQAPIDH